MSFEFQCQCGKLLSAEDDWVGRHARCPDCDLVLEIPQPAWAAPETAPPRQPTAANREKRIPPKSPPRQRPAGRPKTTPNAARQTDRSPLTRKTTLNAIGVTGIILLVFAAFFLGRVTRSPATATATDNLAPEPAATRVSNIADVETQPTAATVSRMPQVATLPAAPVSSVPEVKGVPTAPTIIRRPQVATLPATAALVGGTQDSDSRPQEFGGTRRGGINLPNGEKLGLFIDPSRPGIPDSPQCRSSRQLLKAIALNAADLLFCLAESQAITKDLANDGDPDTTALHVLVFPLEGQLVSEDDPFIPFVAGPIDDLAQLRRLSGTEWQMEVWPAQATREMGLPNHVQWWGDVGVAVANQGRITHLLLRGPIIQPDDPDDAADSAEPPAPAP